jgi:hypothetical protein
MLTAMVPWYVRALVVALLSVAAGATGWISGAGHVQQRWDDDKAVHAQVVAHQVIRNAQIATAQTNVTQEVSHAVEGRIDAVHRYYAGRVRQRTAVRTGAVPASSGAAAGAAEDAADAGPVAAESYDALAERCAVTTTLALGWQQWWTSLIQIDQP